MRKFNPHMQAMLNRLKNEPVIFVQFDTTSPNADRQISRICIWADNALAYSQMFKVDDDVIVDYNHHVAEATGINEDDLNGATLALTDERANIEKMLHGKLIVCNDKNFLLETLETNELDVAIDDADILDIREVARIMRNTDKGGWKFVLDTFAVAYQDDITTLERGFCMYQAATKLKDMIP
jgi:hypothetical protein